MILTNTSPLIHVVRVFDRLEILGEIFGRVIVPLEVAEELEAGRHRDEAAEPPTLLDDPSCLSSIRQS